MTSMPLEINKNSPFWINFMIGIKNNKKVLIITSILQLISMPVLMMVSVSNEVSDKSSFMNAGIYSVVAVFALAVCVFMGISIALTNFSYLYKKSQVDMIYSLPVSIKDRFFSDLLSGFAVYTGPYTGAMLLTLLIHGVSLLRFDEWREASSDITPEMIKVMFAGLLIMTFLYILSILVTTCCGTLFESAAYIVIINILIPSSIAIFYALNMMDLYGIDMENGIIEVIKYTSPVGGLIYLFSALDSDYIGNAYFLKWVIGYLLVIAAVTLLSYFLYKKRKAEDVSKPFVYKMLYHITITIIIVDIISGALEDDDAFMPLLIFSAVVFLIFETVRNRGFKKIGMSAVRYAATVVASIIVLVFIDYTGMFGIEYYVPSASSVKSVTIQYKGIDADLYTDSFTTENRTVINGVIKAQKEHLKAEKSVLDSSDDKYNYIEITYNTKLGSKISREYSMNYEQISNLNILNMNEDYAETVKKYIMETCGIIENKKYRTCSLEIYSKLQVNGRSFDNVPRSNIEELAEAYKQDMMAQSMEELLTPDDIYCYIYNLPVRDTYSNTIAVLEENGYEPYSIYSDISSESELGSLNVVVYTPDNYHSFDDDEYTASFGDYTTDNDGVYLSEKSEVFKKLIEVAQPLYITTDECYVLRIGGDRYVIPYEYNDLAEEAFLYTNDYYGNNYDYD